MFTRSVRKTLVFNTICTICSTQTVYYRGLLCVKYVMHAYAGPTCICRMHAPSNADSANTDSGTQTHRHTDTQILMK
jgi:hypothetical protein